MREYIGSEILDIFYYQYGGPGGIFIIYFYIVSFDWAFLSERKTHSNPRLTGPKPVALFQLSFLAEPQAHKII